MAKKADYLLTLRTNQRCVSSVDKDADILISSICFPLGSELVHIRRRSNSSCQEKTEKSPLTQMNKERSWYKSGILIFTGRRQTVWKLGGQKCDYIPLASLLRLCQLLARPAFYRRCLRCEGMSSETRFFRVSLSLVVITVLLLIYS